MKLKAIPKFLTMACLTASMIMPSAAAYADTTKNSAETAFVRAKLDFINEDGLSSVSEDMLIFSEKDKWVKEGEYYYYVDPLEDGQKVELISGVKTPTEWAKDTSGKTFHIVVTAEAAENMDGQANWSDGYVRTSTSDKNYGNRKIGYKTYNTKDLQVHITEYQIEKNGQKVPYQNNKLVEPGEDISKIVEISVNITSDIDYRNSGGGSSGGGGGSRSSRPRDNSEVYPIPPDTEVIPIQQNPPAPPKGLEGVGRVPTGDNSMMIPMAAAAGCALVILLAILFKRRREEKQD